MQQSTTSRSSDPVISLYGRLLQDVTVEAWSDLGFSRRLAATPAQVVSTYARERDIIIDDETAEEIARAVPPSPVGEPILLSDTSVVQLSSTSDPFSNCATPHLHCGAELSLTADCACPNTTTGACSCFSIWGTPCAC